MHKNYLLNFIKNLDISHAFGMAADSVNGFSVALSAIKSVKSFSVFNEKSAANAVLSYWEKVHKPAIAFGTSGPGTAHLLQSIYYAHKNAVPAVFVVGVPVLGSPKETFQDIEIETFARELGISFFDVRADEKLLTEVSFSDLPCVIAVDKNNFTSSRYLQKYITDELKHEEECIACSDDTTFAEEIVSESLLLENSVARPSGWAVGSLLSSRSDVCGGDFRAAIALKDLLECFADFVDSVKYLSGYIEVICRDDNERKFYERYLEPMIYGVLEESDYVLDRKLDITPVLCKESDFEIGSSPSFVAVEHSDHSGVFQPETLEGNLYSGGWGRLGAKVSVNTGSFFDFLGGVSTAFDLRLDNVCMTINAEETVSEEIKSYFPLFGEKAGEFVSDCKEAQVSLIVSALKNSKRPVFVVGSKSIPYSEELIQLAEKLLVPITCTMGALWAYKNARQCVGMIGSSGNSINEKIRSESDLLIYFGVTNRGLAHDVMRVDRSYIDVSDDVSMMNLRSEKDRQICADIGSVVQKIDEAFPQVSSRDKIWGKLIKQARSTFLRPERRISEKFSRQYLSARTVIREVLSQFNPETTLVLVDIGLNTLWAARTIPSAYKVLYARSFATMGTATYSALGFASTTHKDIIAITGDGGFALSAGEFLYQVDNDVQRADKKRQLAVLVLNNDGLGAVRYEQEVCGMIPSLWRQPRNITQDVGNILPHNQYVALRSKKQLETFAKKSIPNATWVLIDAYVDPYEAPVPARLIDGKMRKDIIKSWKNQGFHGVYSALRTMSYVTDLGRF